MAGIMEWHRNKHDQFIILTIYCTWVKVYFWGFIQISVFSFYVFFRKQSIFDFNKTFFNLHKKQNQHFYI